VFFDVSDVSSSTVCAYSGPNHPESCDPCVSATELCVVSDAGTELCVVPVTELCVVSDAPTELCVVPVTELCVVSDAPTEPCVVPVAATDSAADIERTRRRTSAWAFQTDADIPYLVDPLMWNIRPMTNTRVRMRVQPDIATMIRQVVDRYTQRIAAKYPCDSYNQLSINQTREIHEILAQTSWGTIIGLRLDEDKRSNWPCFTVRWNFISDLDEIDEKTRNLLPDMRETVVRFEHGMWNMLERPFETNMSIYDVVPDTI